MKITRDTIVKIATAEDIKDSFKNIDRNNIVYRLAGTEQKVHWGDSCASLTGSLAIDVIGGGWVYIPIICLNTRGFLI